jgi:glycine/D-amino acid oxidase-like deaminating enzyme
VNGVVGYQGVSFWLGGVGDLAPGAALGGDTSVDVAVVGAGFTGLWTAYYLAVADPSLRIAVVEAEVAGFGASGRNGGWCSALFPQSVPALVKRHGRGPAVAMHRAMQSTVDEVGAVAKAEGIDCDFHKGGTVVLARSPLQLSRAAEDVEVSDEYRLGLSLLDADAARARCGATGVIGGTYTPDCAAIHPGKLVRGLAATVRRLGVAVYERTRAIELRPGALVTSHGTIKCDHLVRATEGYTAGLPGFRRVVAPVYSLMVATDPLPASVWDEIGLADRETFSDFRHLIIYGQRTADDRLAFGGRGAPYHFGSTIRPEFDRDPRVFAELRRVLADLFPVLGDAPIAASWGGPLGVPRDWHASVGLDRATGIAWAGGYVGDGVATTNLAGRTIADLILERDTDITRLPWVNHRSPRWEPEPLRWIGVNAGLRAMTSADAVEARTGRPSRRAALFGRLLGH